MNVTKRIAVPTGFICVAEGDKGALEFLSIGDYGKEVNLNKDGAVGDNLPLLPLSEKWVITISTQYGCSMGCQFCDVPLVGKGINATLNDLQQQVLHGLGCFPDVTWSNRLNIHYARMGEPTWNPNVLDHAKWMKDHVDPEYNVHPVLTTMMPRKNEWLKTAVHTWVRIKNRVYRGNAGLQISINSTDEDERQRIFSGNALSLLDISRLMEGCVPVGRKFTLNFPVGSWIVEPEVLRRYFDPERFLIKLTPIHKTATAERFGHETDGDYTSPAPYKSLADKLRGVGYDVLVFIASEDEDRGMITCGNAILAGKQQPRTREGELQWVGGARVTGAHAPWHSASDPFAQSIDAAKETR